MNPNAKQKKWQRIITKWRESGLSQKQFCQENGINVSTFYFYKKKLKKISPFVELSPVKLVPENISIHLNSRNISISIPNSFCENTLLRLLKTLGGKNHVC